MRAVVAAWVGAGNLGDELLLRASLRLLHERGVDVTVLSVDPPATESLHGTAVRGHGAAAAALGEAELLVLGGGGLVQDRTSLLSPAYQLQRPLAARVRRRPVLGWGLGALPLRSAWNRQLARAALESAHTLVARDAPSQRALRDLGLPRVRRGADLAFTLPPPTPRPREDRFLVCLRPRFAAGGVLPGRRRELQPDHERFAAAAARHLDEVASRTGLAPALLSMEPRRDDPLHLAIADRLTASPQVLRPALDELLGTFAGSRLVIGSRYHAVVAATLGGTPAVPLAYADKVAALAAELGPGWPTLDHATSALPGLAGAAEVALRMTTDQVHAARDRLVAAAAVNAAALDEVLAAISG